MLVDPDLVEITNGARGILRGIDACIEAQCLVSAVTLIYSAVDALSALTRPLHSPDTTRSEFLNWVERYMNPAEKLGCSAHDLNGARCGILHTYGADSRLRRTGRPRAIVYRWTNGPAPDPQHRKSIPKDAIVLCVERLRDGLKCAVGLFLKDAASVRDLEERVEKHRQDLLCYRPWKAIPIRVAA